MFIKDLYHYFLIKNSSLFNQTYYLLNNPDLHKSVIDPLWHYLKIGWEEGRNPSSAFSTVFYLEQYSDVRDSGINPLLHFIKFGIKEGRACQPSMVSIEISPAAYPENYQRLLADINTTHHQQAGVSPETDLDPIITIDSNNLHQYVEQLSFPKVDHPQISIIIPVVKDPTLLVACLRSISMYNDSISPSYEILVVQDGVNQNLTEVIKTIPNITFVPQPARKGFSKSCNLGAKNARGEFLLFINDDAQMATRDFLRTLLEPFNLHSDVGAVGPKILYPSGILQEAGGLINKDGTVSLIGHGEPAFQPQYNYAREVDYCSGVCIAIEKALFDELGGFDEIYSPAYYEDVDLCLKIASLGRKIIFNPESVIYHHLSATMNSIADNEFKLNQVTKNKQIFINRWQDRIDELNRVKLIAFYLPQFHPIPENDLWWEKGFTEWHNVARAKPIFKGHYQPHLPADLGFYDLRVPEVMEEQVKLAKKYGVDGFCFYYYWFDGKRLLEMPVDRMLATGKPDFPFCLCWANENWTSKWDGGENDLIIGQNHSDQDDQLVIRDLIRYFRHPNYLQIEGKPIILIYRMDLFQNFLRTVNIWREECSILGIKGPYIIVVNSFQQSINEVDPKLYGANATVEFPPHGNFSNIPVPDELTAENYQGRFYEYREIALHYASLPFPEHNHFKSVLPAWDNSPRNTSPSGAILHNSDPGIYQAWLEYAIKVTREHHAGDKRVVFINAWNEWAEGNYLEPDQKFGHQYLMATKNAVDQWMLKSRRVKYE